MNNGSVCRTFSFSLHSNSNYVNNESNWNHASTIDNESCQYSSYRNTFSNIPIVIVTTMPFVKHCTEIFVCWNPIWSHKIYNLQLKVIPILLAALLVKCYLCHSNRNTEFALIYSECLSLPQIIPLWHKSVLCIVSSCEHTCLTNGSTIQICLAYLGGRNRIQLKLHNYLLLLAAEVLDEHPWYLSEMALYNLPTVSCYWHSTWLFVLDV